MVIRNIEHLSIEEYKIAKEWDTKGFKCFICILHDIALWCFYYRHDSITPSGFGRSSLSSYYNNFIPSGFVRDVGNSFTGINGRLLPIHPIHDRIFIINERSTSGLVTPKGWQCYRKRFGKGVRTPKG
jgi:hypothetical protein